MVCLTSIDVGIGIVESLVVRQRFAALRASSFKGLGQGERLRRLLEGMTIPSSTGQLHRGRGLPSMRAECKQDRIKNLAIVTNKALARIETEEYENLECGFPGTGTIVCWEVEGSKAG